MNLFMNKFTVLTWPPQPPGLNPREHILQVNEREVCIMDVQLTNVQLVCDAIMPIWMCTKNSEGKRVKPDNIEVYLRVSSKCI